MEMGDLAGLWIQAMEARPRCQPKHPGPVLRNMDDRTASVGRTAVECVVRKDFGARIHAIQGFIAAYPQDSIAILEKRGDKRARKAIPTRRIVYEHLEIVAVVAIESVLGTEPNEASVILDNLCHTSLRESVCSRYAANPRITRFLHGNPDFCREKLWFFRWLRGLR
jgi:hypothetical protein